MPFRVMGCPLPVVHCAECLPSFFFTILDCDDTACCLWHRCVALQEPHPSPQFQPLPLQAPRATPTRSWSLKRRILRRSLSPPRHHSACLPHFPSDHCKSFLHPHRMELAPSRIPHCPRSQACSWARQCRSLKHRVLMTFAVMTLSKLMNDKGSVTLSSLAGHVMIINAHWHSTRTFKFAMSRFSIPKFMFTILRDTPDTDLQHHCR